MGRLSSATEEHMGSAVSLPALLLSRSERDTVENAVQKPVDKVFNDEQLRALFGVLDTSRSRATVFFFLVFWFQPPTDIQQGAYI